MSESLTIAGFIGLVTLLLAVGGVVASVMNRVSRLSERLSRLEARYEAHVTNGDRHKP